MTNMSKPLISQDLLSLSSHKRTDFPAITNSPYNWSMKVMTSYEPNPISINNSAEKDDERLCKKLHREQNLEAIWSNPYQNLSIIINPAAARQSCTATAQTIIPTKRSQEPCNDELDPFSRNDTFVPPSIASSLKDWQVRVSHPHSDRPGSGGKAKKIRKIEDQGKTGIKAAIDSTNTSTGTPTSRSPHKFPVHTGYSSGQVNWKRENQFVGLKKRNLYSSISFDFETRLVFCFGLLNKGAFIPVFPLILYFSYFLCFSSATRPIW